MDRELLFAKTLEKVKKLAREQGNSISQEQLEEAFLELGLDKGQLALVSDYLEKHHIGIGEPLESDEFLSGEEAGYLESYLEELEGIQEASQGEKEAVTISAMAGDKQAQARMMEIWLPEVAQIAKLYAGQGVPWKI